MFTRLLPVYVCCYICTYVTVAFALRFAVRCTLLRLHTVRLLVVPFVLCLLVVRLRLLVGCLLHVDHHTLFTFTYCRLPVPRFGCCSATVAGLPVTVAVHTRFFALPATGSAVAARLRFGSTLVSRTLFLRFPLLPYRYLWFPTRGYPATTRLRVALSALWLRFGYVLPFITGCAVAAVHARYRFGLRYGC